MRCGANGIVDIQLSSTPVRANLRRRRSAILILRVPSSTESSRFLYCRSSQTFFAFFFLPLPMPPGHLDLFIRITLIAVFAFLAFLGLGFFGFFLGFFEGFDELF